MDAIILVSLLLLSGYEPVTVEIEIACAVVLGILLAYALLILGGRAHYKG